MPEFQRRWGKKNTPDTSQIHLTDLTEACPPLGSLDVNVQETDLPEKISGYESTPVSQETDQPFPLGNGGLDARQVDLAERHNTRLGVVDPVQRKLNVLWWLYQHYQEAGDTDLAAEVKGAYESLRGADPHVVRLARMGDLDQDALLKRLVNGQWWLIQEHEKWFAGSPDAATDETFQKALDGWVAMESQLRQRHGYRACIHGEGRRCPEDASVVCDFCASN
jgi:hypothetical protein